MTEDLRHPVSIGCRPSTGLVIYFGREPVARWTNPDDMPALLGLIGSGGRVVESPMGSREISEDQAKSLAVLAAQFWRG